MIQIDDKLISFDVFEKHFCCDLPQCLGACCVHGLSGAPLEPEEIDILKKEIGIIEQFLKPGGIEAVRKQGVAIRDFDGDMVTPLIEGEECAFCIEENGIATCAIEKAWLQGKVGFRKPISCHLYPIRVKKYSTFTAINYDQWSICQPARDLGLKNGILVYKFLKEAITRAYGKEFYHEMEVAAQMLEEQRADSQNESQQ
ncbi:MAG TPA: DUF3109 family protein [Tenuifilaceae bacterium]|nr:DUF3109 family protein [Tenuifilaceae bacterium]